MRGQVAAGWLLLTFSLTVPTMSSAQAAVRGEPLATPTSTAEVFSSAPPGDVISSRQPAAPSTVQLVPLSPLSTPLSSSTATDTKDLEAAKLQAEIEKLKLESEDLTSPWRRAGTLLGWLVPLAALATVAIGWTKQRQDNREQQEKDREQREKDRQQREAEAAKQFDTVFATTTANLGSTSPSLQASAAASLSMFLGPTYVDHRESIVRVALANLKMDQAEFVRALLVEALGRALTASDPQLIRSWNLNLSQTRAAELTIIGALLPDHLHADRIDLRKATLSGATMWKASLVEADLTSALMRRTNLGQANLSLASLAHADLSGAKLTSARLRGMDAKYASFRGAFLQSAHFEGSDLRGARFDGADVNDTYFAGCLLDQDALRGLKKAANANRAHFDADSRAKMDALT